MNEENPPTPRLRPRPPMSAGEAGAASVPTPPPSVQPAASASLDPNGPKLRLRPRDADAPGPAPALFLDVPPASPTPAASESAPSSGLSGQEKLSLRSVSAAASAGSAVPPPFPLVAPDAALAAGTADPAGSAPGVESLPSSRSGFGWLLLAGLILLGGLGFFALRPYLLPPPAVPAPKAAPAKSTSPTPLPAPAPAVAPTAHVSSPERTPSPPPASQPASAPAAPLPGATSTLIAPGVMAAIDLEVAGDPSPAFRAFVANAAIRGVIGGQSPKALINGKIVHVGDYADSALGITLAGVNAPGKTLLFRDPTGATVTRRY